MNRYTALNSSFCVVNMVSTIKGEKVALKIPFKLFYNALYNGVTASSHIVIKLAVYSQMEHGLAAQACQCSCIRVFRMATSQAVPQY